MTDTVCFLLVGGVELQHTRMSRQVDVVAERHQQHRVVRLAPNSHPLDLHRINQAQYTANAVQFHAVTQSVDAQFAPFGVIDADTVTHAVVTHVAQGEQRTLVKLHHPVRITASLDLRTLERQHDR